MRRKKDALSRLSNEEPPPRGHGSASVAVDLLTDVGHGRDARAASVLQHITSELRHPIPAFVLDVLAVNFADTVSSFVPDVFPIDFGHAIVFLGESLAIKLVVGHELSSSLRLTPLRLSQCQQCSNCANSVKQLPALARFEPGILEDSAP
jgi:hypothetical protein